MTGLLAAKLRDDLQEASERLAAAISKYDETSPITRCDGVRGLRMSELRGLFELTREQAYEMICHFQSEELRRDDDLLVHSALVMRERRRLLGAPRDGRGRFVTAAK